MKIGIVIPLKASSVSKNWRATCHNLHATVQSLLNQTNQQFTAVIVGHDKPDFMNPLEQLGIMQCSFLPFIEAQPPIPGLIEQDNQLMYEQDRCNKILKGLLHLNAIDTSISHWFALDADDILSKYFIEKLKPYAEYDAIILDNGYFYFKNTGIINEENEFSAYCGSSAILAKKLFQLPNNITGNNYRCIPYGTITHVAMRDHLLQNNHSVAVPTARLIMYVRNNGENISNAAYSSTRFQRLKKYIKMILKAKLNSNNIKNEFGVT